MTRFLFDPRIQAACFLVWCLTWMVLALFSVRPEIPKTPFSDTQLHFLAYLLMAFSAIAFCNNGRQLLLWAVGATIIGFGMECAQILIPTRQFQVIDLIANVGGAMAGYMLAVSTLFVLLRPLRRALAA